MGSVGLFRKGCLVRVAGQDGRDESTYGGVHTVQQCKVVVCWQRVRLCSSEFNVMSVQYPQAGGR